MKLGKIIGTKEWCAIKIMKETESTLQINSFMDEVRLLSQCKNRQIIQLISASTKGCSVTTKSKKFIFYIATTYAKFGELYKIIREMGPLDEPLARTYFFQLLKGIEYLHSINICHRDIKLENLLLDQDSKLIISDFGCASKIRTELGKSLPFESSYTVGSKEYNPPEMNIDKLYYGEKADVFSAGVCLFLMLIGHPPFKEASPRDSYFKKLTKKDTEEYWSIYKSANIPPLFKDLFQKLTEMDFTKRIEIHEIYSHPWMKGRIYSPEEAKEVIHDRLQLYVKVSWRQTREMMKKKKRETHKKKSIESKGVITDYSEIRRRLDFDNIMKKTGEIMISTKPDKETQEKKNQDKD